MIRPKFRYPAAVISWLDAHARPQAVEYEESEVIQQHRPEECQILGLVIKDDETGISLFTEQTGPTSVRGLSFIPRAMIKDVIYVNLTPQRKSKNAGSNTIPQPNPQP